MSARVVYMLLELLALSYKLLIMVLSEQQRKKPLPEEVADIYEPERYRKYLNYVSDNRKMVLLSTAVTLTATAALIFSPVYQRIERLTSGNAYLIYLLTTALFLLVSEIIDVPFSWYNTFRIEEKYGLNKKDRKEFWKDEILDFLGNTVLMAGLGVVLVFIGEHMEKWTGGFSVSFSKAFLLGLGIVLVIAAFMLIASLFSLFMMRNKYTFTPLEEGELKDKIMQLQKGSKKQVRLIYVYNESKKSTSKNAALLKLLWHREFWIADNFLNENAEDELLAVLSHEIGHLKHKKNVLNYLQYAGTALIFVAFILLIAYPAPVLSMLSWVRNSFGITANNFYVIMMIALAIFSPVSVIAGMFTNYRSREEEKEADREAVKNGYGEALIRTFRKLSSDELVNVNPHPLIEFLEYDHPGMYQRIKTIREAAVQEAATK